MTKDILVLKGHGLDLRVSYGGLKIKDGFPHKAEINESFINRGLNDVDHLVILGFSGSITFEAIKWIIDQNIMVTFCDYEGNIITSFMPEKHISGVVKRRQATANDELKLKISAWLLSEKFKEQRKTLTWLQNSFYNVSWWDNEREKRINQAISISKDREKLLKSSLNLASHMLLEAQSAAAYWHCFEGIPLKWEKANHIPANWLTIGNRTSPKTGSPRKAIDPFNAALNYLYAVLETKVRFTCLVNNVDPDFGILHVDHATRGSLVFDLMEPHRSKVDRLLLEWVLNRTFNKKDFFETREGVCRVSQELISQIIPIIDGLSPSITNTVKEFAKYFKDKAYRQKPKHFQEVIKEKPALRLKPEVPKESKQLDKVCCLECGKVFIPEKPGQIFCSKTHKDTYRKRKLREKRKAEGKCPQCGKPMSGGAKGTYKEKLSYCEKCKGYWERRYKIRSNGG